MDRRRIPVAYLAVAALALRLLPAVAAPPPAPWVARDIGGPGAPGSTDVDTSGIWTLRGSGKDLVGKAADQFHYAYQVVKGDAAIAARFLSMEGGHPAWAKVGLMVRENDTAGSPNLDYFMVPEYGLNATRRLVQDDAPGLPGTLPDVGPGGKAEPNLASAVDYRHPSRTGGTVLLPPYGFLVESPTFVAFDAQSWNGLRYDAPVLFTLRSLDGNPLGRCRNLRVYHGFGDARVNVGGATRTIVKEATVALGGLEVDR